MKALQLQDYGRLEIVDVTDPQPQPGEVLIEIVATGICGSDFHGFTGENGRRIPGQIMGHESVGRVAGLGEGVSGLSLGQPVTFNPVVVPEADLETYRGREQMSPGRKVIGVAPEITAAFAQRITVPFRNVVPLPETMPIELGALIEPLAVAVHAVRRAQAAPGMNVLVLGGGPIGQSVVLALQMAGVTNIVVTEMMESRKQLISQLGAHVVDAAAEDAAEQILELFSGPADLAIDAVGIDSTLSLALRATRLGANICLVGMGAPRLSLEAFKISTEERSLIGSFTYSAKDFADAADWMGSAPPQAAQLISRQVPMAAAQEEFTHLAEGGDTPGKVLVMLTEEQQN
ncbi:zinc-dependent alcohol dehydrogenase [Nesterenkonia ebinurensis]|uniref:zinc-dependent alcohol dehydrogenase n=1 Tax=Nesterenkonia ebinurensis TaxID=2608252 RepID=UPI00123E419F|nr:zinc-binding dehydrogenase [Nesterenkonia ebinurensis]